MQVATGKSILGGVAIGPLRVYRKEETQTAAASAADGAAFLCFSWIFY